MEKMLNNRIEQLIQRFKFEELSKEDKALVLSIMPEEDYRAYQIIVGSAAVMDTPKVPIDIQKSLQKDLFETKAAKGSMLGQALTYKIPFWLIGGLTLLLFFGSKMFSSNHEVIENIVQQEIAPTIVFQTDTIFKEIISEPIIVTKVVEKIIYLEKEVSTPEPIRIAQNVQTISTPEKLDIDNAESFFGDVDGSVNEIIRPKGRSVSQDQALMNILDFAEPTATMKLK